MNSSLKDDFLGLKSKLENIEKEFEVKLKDVEEKENKFKNMDEQINEIVNSKENIIKLNIGGKIFQTRASTLLAKKDTIFYKLIGTDLQEKKEFKNEFFFDRPFQHFNLILDYLRAKKFSLLGIKQMGFG
jgi:hypothetical protein